MRPPLKKFFRGGSWRDPPLKLISRGRSCHGPPLQFSVQKIKMVQKIKNSKIKKKKHPSQPATTTSRTVSSYYFFWKYTHMHHLGSEPPTSSLACTFVITTLHNHLWLFGTFYSFKLTWNWFGHHHPALQLHFYGRVTLSPPLKLFSYFISKFI